MPNDSVAGRARAELMARELWTNALSIYRAEVGNTRQHEASLAVIDYIANRLLAGVGETVPQPQKIESGEAGAAAQTAQESRQNWIDDHFDRHGHIRRREHYDECKCGATFWCEAARTNDPVTFNELGRGVLPNTSNQAGTPPEPLSPGADLNTPTALGSA